MYSSIEEMLQRIRARHPLPQVVADGTPIGLILHELPLGHDRHLVLDVATGLGWLLAGRAEPRQLGAGNALARLAMLDWCWHRMPVPTATALWQLEYAELAFATGEPALWASALGMLRQSLAELRGATIHPLPALLRLDDRWLVLASRWERTGRLPDPAILRSVVTRLRAALRARSAARARTYIGALDPELPGCFEVEWDRVPPFQLDPRENALRVRVSARSWSLTVAAQRTVHRSGEQSDKALWAQLVDERTGVIAAEARLLRVPGGYSVNAGLLDGPPAQWRVDISARPGENPRGSAARSGAIARQAVFRAQLLGRFGSLSSGIAEWAELVRRRADQKLHQYRAAKPGGAFGCLTGSPGLRRSEQPFLAEELLDPAAISLFLSSHAGSRLPPL